MTEGQLRVQVWLWNILTHREKQPEAALQKETSITIEHLGTSVIQLTFLQ